MAIDLNIQEGSDNNVKPGIYNNAVFQGIEEFTVIHGQHAGKQLIRWKFEIEGKRVNSVSGVSKPTLTNQLGKNLCAISGRPLYVGTADDPAGFVGKTYTATVIQKGEGTIVQAFILNN